MAARPAQADHQLGTSGTALQVAGQGALGNITVTARSVVVSAADADLELSLDDAVFVPALTGITLTPSSGAVTFYARGDGAGVYRVGTLKATDTLAAGALSAASTAMVVDPAAAASLSLALPAAGVAGSAVSLTLTALDGGGNPATSVAPVTLNSASATGAFSLDSGYSWAAITHGGPDRRLGPAAVPRYRERFLAGAGQLRAWERPPLQSPFRPGRPTWSAALPRLRPYSTIQQMGPTPAA